MGRVSGTPLNLSEYANSESAVALKAALLALEPASIVVEAAGVDGVDTPCIEVLIAAKRWCEREGGSMRIDNPTDGFTRSLTMLGIESSELEIGRSGNDD